VRLSERRTLIGLFIAGVIGAILLMPAVYFVGLWLAPPRPVPVTTHVPRLLSDAIWARADGGRATEMQPLNPINFVKHRACRAIAARTDDPRLRGERRAECMKQLPAVQAADYLSGVHIRDEHADSGGFREGISQFATAAWLTRSWTKAELVDTLAARGEFGSMWRGADAAARGYFARELGELSLSQAALLAGLIGDRGSDPWCDSSAAASIRHRILERMRDNLAIDDSAFREADTEPIELGPPPADHGPCQR
jgi:Transglycosylase